MTERAVLALGPDGVELRELAPGIDLERNVVGRMDFSPVMRQLPEPMAWRHFAMA